MLNLNEQYEMLEKLQLCPVLSEIALQMIKICFTIINSVFTPSPRLQLFYLSVL